MKQISELLSELQEENSAISLFLLAHIYEMGKLVPKDLEKSFQFYMQTAQVSTNDPIEIQCKIFAAYNMWVLQISGTGSPIIKTRKKAPLWIELAKNHNCHFLLFRIGVMYEFGIEFKQDYNKARRYYALAESGFPKASIRLGLLYEQGLGCPPDRKKARKYYRKAKDNDCKEASIFLRKELCEWPTEEWMSIVDKHTVIIASSPDLGFEELSTFINSYESHTIPILSDKKLNAAMVRWFLTLVRTGVSHNTYVEAERANEKLNTFFQKNRTYLSDSVLMVPLYARSSYTVESYVKLYLRAKIWLIRARKAGSSEAEHLLLKLLESHQTRAEITCKSVFNRFILNVEAGEKIWQKALLLIKQEQNNYYTSLISVDTIPGDNMPQMLEDAISESKIEQYFICNKLAIDYDEERNNDRRFFDTAVNAGEFYVAKEFLEECDFDINYLITGKSISPLEFIIIQGFIETLKDALLRGEVDVNFNAPIFCAIEQENIDALQTLLEHPLIDLRVKKKINGALLSAEEFSNKCSNPKVKQLIETYVMKVQNEVDPQLIGSLYFQYRKQDVDVVREEPNTKQSVIATKMYYQ